MFMSDSLWRCTFGNVFHCIFISPGSSSESWEDFIQRTLIEREDGAKESEEEKEKLKGRLQWQSVLSLTVNDWIVWKSIWALVYLVRCTRWSPKSKKKANIWQIFMLVCSGVGKQEQNQANFAHLIFVIFSPWAQFLVDFSPRKGA